LEDEAPALTLEQSEQQKQERTVFVKNLNFSTTDEMLEQVFKEISTSGSKPFKIISCKIVRNSKNQLSRGYGFVELDTREAAEKAIKKL
jgi:multiple RNA-binding domain-containing protein 1